MYKPYHVVNAIPPAADAFAGMVDAQALAKSGYSYVRLKSVEVIDDPVAGGIIAILYSEFSHYYTKGKAGAWAPWELLFNGTDANGSDIAADSTAKALCCYCERYGAFPIRKRRGMEQPANKQYDRQYSAQPAYFCRG